MPEPAECQRTQPILLTVDNVTKRFGGVVAVDGCSLGIRRGTITGLIGPNGAGKTTLFNMIAGLYPPDAGRIWFEGERSDGLPPQRIFARKVVRTFQIARALQRLGRTFLLIEHDMDLVMDICNPIIVMSHGRTLMEGTPRQVCNDPRVMAAYLGV